MPERFVILRLWVADDDNGNEAIHRQEITIIDTEGPDFAGTPEEIVIDCGDINETDYTVEIAQVWWTV